MKHDHYKIYPTADIISYWRGFSDITFASEISEISNSEKTVEALFEKTLPDLSPEEIAILLNKITFNFGALMSEVRYKCLDEQIKKVGIKNIYEVASGISPRGITATEDPGIVYFATDIPEKVSRNKEIMEIIMRKHNINRRNLHFYPVNVLDENQFISTAEKLEGPVCIVHEGLLPYFSNEEKQILGNSIRKVLEKNGGYWITPDIMYKDIMIKRREKRTSKENKNMSLLRSVISGVSERDIINNAFESEKSAGKFFKELGFLVKKYPKYDDTFKVSSLKYISDAIEKKKALSFDRLDHIYVMSLDK